MEITECYRIGTFSKERGRDRLKCSVLILISGNIRWIKSMCENTKEPLGGGLIFVLNQWINPLVNDIHSGP